MRVALVHDWLTGMRGGEKVLSCLCGLLPAADLFTLVHVPGACDEAIERMRIRTSFLNDLPGVGRYYRHLLPLMPAAAESLDLSAYDLVISSSHCAAKGVLRSPSSLHVCYCHTPMRYVWLSAEAYRRAMGLSGLALVAMRGYLQAWDRRSSTHVDHFLANSRDVAARIRRIYGREAHVVHPPVDAAYFTPVASPREDFYLMVTALVPYKRVDQAILAFSDLDRRLVIIGAGPQMSQLQQMAPDNVSLAGWQTNEVVRDHYRRCRALVFPGEEDFGLAPLEAMACGAPVIAYGTGGALETVRDASAPSAEGPTGLLYRPQTPEALAAAVRAFEQMEGRFEAASLTRWARRFDVPAFLQRFRAAVVPFLQERGLGEPWAQG